ncbi:MAG TPA: hypothetical protein VL992_15800 [Tepidisphaeraceae bacterium]|nr:hypothetical protein [Tepidisphaeraceae bacterium]
MSELIEAAENVESAWAAQRRRTYFSVPPAAHDLRDFGDIKLNVRSGD